MGMFFLSPRRSLGASFLDALDRSRRCQAARAIDYYRHLFDEGKVANPIFADIAAQEPRACVDACSTNCLAKTDLIANGRGAHMQAKQVFLALSFAFIVFVTLVAVICLRPLFVRKHFHDRSLAGGDLRSVLIGSVAAGLAGFAFSAITGSLLFHWIAPMAAVPLLLACSITTQLFSIAALWNTMQWKRCLPILVGGFLGIPVGAFVLQHLSAGKFDVAFGAFLVCYAAYMLWRPNLKIHQDGGGSIAAIAIGFVGGITGGAVAFPGAFPTIWCSLRALPKEIQRGTVQPFILIMQVATLAYFSKLGIFVSRQPRRSFGALPRCLAVPGLAFDYFVVSTTRCFAGFCLFFCSYRAQHSYIHPHCSERLPHAC